MVISTVVDERWFTICCSFIACFAISGNILVIVVHQTSRSLRSVTSIFIKGLAVTDMLAGIAIVPGMIPITIKDNFWGEFYCKVIGSYYILWTSAKASILILVFATTERYFAIVHPVHHKRYFTNLAAKILLVLAWVIAVLMNLFSLIVLHADGDSCIVRWDGNKHVRNLIGVMVFVLSFFLPLTLMFLAYIKMFVSLREREKRLNRMDGTRSNKSRSRMISYRIKKNIISMLFIVVCTFTICWAPDQICYLLMNLEVKSFDYEYSVVYPYFVLLAMANSCLNPVIYSFKSKPFKDALRKMLGRKNRVQDNGGSLNSIAQNCSATGLGTSPQVGNTNAKTTDSSETVSPAL